MTNVATSDVYESTFIRSYILPVILTFDFIQEPITHYAKFIKRGFGRGTDHASQDVRAGLLTREEGFELAKKYDIQRPNGLDYYLKITGLTEEEFLKILKNKREGKSKELP